MVQNLREFYCFELDNKITTTKNQHMTCFIQNLIILNGYFVFTIFYLRTDYLHFTYTF